MLPALAELQLLDEIKCSPLRGCAVIEARTQY